MNKTVLTLATVALSVCAAFGDAPAAEGKKKPRRLTPEIKAMLMARTGGTVVKRAEGPEFVFINAQKRVATDEIKKVPAELEKVLNFPFAIRDAEIKGNPIAEASSFLSFKAAAVILVVDDAELSTPTLAALEGKWGIVNVAALAADAPDTMKLASRVRKEMWRTFRRSHGSIKQPALWMPHEVRPLPRRTGRAALRDRLPRPIPAYLSDDGQARNEAQCLRDLPQGIH